MVKVARVRFYSISVQRLGFSKVYCRKCLVMQLCTVVWCTFVLVVGVQDRDWRQDGGDPLFSH